MTGLRDPACHGERLHEWMFHSDRQRSGEARVVEELTARVAAVARGDAVSDAANAIGNDISDIF